MAYFFHIHNNFTTLAGYGGKPEWIDDGYCDDINNNEGCEYDGGDCCGVYMNKRFCIECECIRKSYIPRKIIIYIVMKGFLWNFRVYMFGRRRLSSRIL